MIPVPSAARVNVAAGPTDIRKRFNGLSELVQETLKDYAALRARAIEKAAALQETLRDLLHVQTGVVSATLAIEKLKIELSPAEAQDLRRLVREAGADRAAGAAARGPGGDGRAGDAGASRASVAQAGAATAARPPASPRGRPTSGAGGGRMLLPGLRRPALRLGEDATEELEYVPASFRVVFHLRPRYACRSCEVVHQMPMPSRPIERARPGPGLLAQALVAKYDDHLPLYRQSEIYAVKAWSWSARCWPTGSAAPPRSWRHRRARGRLQAARRRHAGPPDERRRLRQAEAAPRLAELRTWLDQQRAKLPSSSKLAGALRYSLKRWPALTRYVDDGRIEIDKSPCRTGAALRRGWAQKLSVQGLGRGGERAAFIYTLIETAKLSGLNPAAWLTDIIGRIADHPARKPSIALMTKQGRATKTLRIFDDFKRSRADPAGLLKGNWYKARRPPSFRNEDCWGLLSLVLSTVID